MRARQGVGAFSTGAYIDVRDQENAHHDAVLRRIYVFTYLVVKA